ncbi:MAG: pantothenate kinase [Pleurocapsa sp.]
MNYRLSKTINDQQLSPHYLGLAIGNSRLHWGLFYNYNLIDSGDSNHLSCSGDREKLIQQILGDRQLDSLTIYLASVVPEQTKLWLEYPQVKLITLSDIPLNNLYSTLGIDRALAVWGAGNKYGYPCLVIDGGTALTFTAVDNKQSLVGGAIVPGLRSQLHSLQQKTAALPEINLPPSLPARWALDTQSAIASGIIYSAIATVVDFINDWCVLFPHSKLILTGGDSKLLYDYLHNSQQLLTTAIVVDPHLIFWGMELVISH